jgi:hypothetical protein
MAVKMSENLFTANALTVLAKRYLSAALAASSG